MEEKASMSLYQPWGCLLPCLGVFRADVEYAWKFALGECSVNYGLIFALGFMDVGSEPPYLLESR